jgi:hypothetical protein
LKIKSFTIEYQKRKLSIYQLVLNKANVMPAATMFAKFKSGSQNLQNPIDTNPITQYFEIGKQTACAGPELIWKIHDAYRKSDGKVSVIFDFFFHVFQFLRLWIKDDSDKISSSFPANQEPCLIRPKHLPM